MIIIAFIFLIVSIACLSYFGVNILLKRWDEAQKSKADHTTSQLEEMFVFVRRKVLIILYIVIPLVAIFVLYITTEKWWLALAGGILGAFFPVISSSSRKISLTVA